MEGGESAVKAPLKHLVVDTGAILKSARLEKVAENFWTVPGVLEEIRDQNARSRLHTLPFKMVEKQPSQEALKFVVQFSRKTGDFANLSRVDLQVLALAYMLELEENGMKHMRAVPIAPVSGAKKAEPSPPPKDCPPAVDAPTAQVHLAVEAPVECPPPPVTAQVHPVEPALPSATLPPTGQGSRILGKSLSSAVHSSFVTAAEASITEGGVCKKESKSSTACATTDFTMQNVLLQVGIPVVSIEGRTVHTVRRWVLKCDACKSITTNMEKMFCPRCGNATLARLACSIASDGEVRYHYKKGRRVNVRGSKYAIPKTRGGREGDMLLREDQLLMGQWAQKAKVKQSVSGMFGDLQGDFSKVQLPAEISIGFGRGKNPNARRGREKRGQKKKKKSKR